MINRKKIKKEAKQILKRNYWRTIAIIFFMALLLGNFNLFTKSRIPIPTISINAPLASSINADIVKETIEKVGNFKIDISNYKPTRGILANVFNNVTSSGNFIFGVLNSFNQLVFHEHLWQSIIILLGAILSFLYWLLIRNVFVIGEKRFFLENKNHKKTKFVRILLPYRIKKLKSISLTMMYKIVKEWLWYLTIIGGFIKHYAYCLVPYILAENPDIKGQNALTLSEELMQGHKWEMFLFDLTFLGWRILDMMTLHFLGVLFVNPYKECCMTEFYFAFREEGKQKKYKNVSLLCDEELLKMEDKYPSEKYIHEERKREKWLHTDYNKKYNLDSIILMFFTASIVGWLWEVGLNLFQYGFFANRGTLHGPWLHIYGWGLMLILLVLKKVREHPILTFFLVILLCGILEYGTAWYLETFKNARWWDYDGFFLNLHGRICMEGLIAFGIAGTFFIYFAAPFLDSLFMKIPKKIKTILCIILSVLYVVDFAYSSKYPNSGEGVSQNFASAFKETIKS